MLFRSNSQEQLNVNVMPLYRRLLIGIGWSVLVVAAGIFFAVLFGLVAIETFSIEGSSGIRTIAGLAITGCLSAALGYMGEE